MAEGVSKDNVSEDDIDNKCERVETEVIELSDCDDSNDKDDCEGSKRLECAVCLQSCVHPARLPCSHIFCFLCLKGIAHGSKKCAMCRHPIPRDYLDNPDLVETLDPEEPKEDREGYEWYYEGRNGWWQYDRRAGAELEAAWSSGRETCELLIAGYLYTIDFKAMAQARRSEPGRQRKIKRDLAGCPKKGVAGIRDLSRELAKVALETEEEGGGDGE